MFNTVQGNLEPDMGIDLEVNGDAEDISDALSYTMRWLKPTGELVEAAELVEDVDAGGLAAGKVKRVWDAGDTDDVGYHTATIEVVRGNGEQQTFPSDGTFIKWRVCPKIGA